MYSPIVQQASTPIPLAGVSSYCAWAIADYEGDDTPDLFALAATTASGKVEVNVLDGEGYQS